MVVAPTNPVAEYASGAKAADDSFERLQAILDRFEITIAEANDLVALEDYEIVVIADDSGSMTCPSPPASQRKLGVPSPTRWDELKETVALIVELGACFDSSGLDIHFLNRSTVTNVKSSRDPAFCNAFRDSPNGGTPLTETLMRVVQGSSGEKPVLFILTDGVPNGGPERFGAELRRVVNKQSTNHTFQVQIMACTGDDAAVGYLNKLDQEFTEVDVTDDYFAEREEVLKAGRTKTFSRGDWCMKAMLGPVSCKFDALDEPLCTQEGKLLDLPPAAPKKSPPQSKGKGATSKMCVVM